MMLVAPPNVVDGARALRRHILAPRPAEQPADTPTFKQLSQAFVEAAKADLDSCRTGSQRPA